MELLLGTVSGEPPPKFSVLVVDGMNNHDWPRATRILKEVLEGSGRFKVDVSTGPSAGGSKEVWSEWRPDFAKYNVVLSNFNGGHTPSSPHWPRCREGTGRVRQAAAGWSSTILRTTRSPTGQPTTK